MENNTTSKYRIRLSSNSELVERVRKEIADNDGYCPLTKDMLEEHKCICKDFWEQDEEGSCKCGIYIKILQYD